jgi:hypothetical protein
MRAIAAPMPLDAPVTSARMPLSSAMGETYHLTACRRAGITAGMKALFAVMMSVALWACGGPSAQQVRTAKLAEYNAETGQLLDLALQVAQKSYKVDPNTIDPKGQFATYPQWYSSEGMRRGTANEGNGDYLVNSADGDIRLSLRVTVVAGPAGKSQIAIVPQTLQMVAGSPQPRELAPDDPNMPGWVKGRVDQLAVDVYNAAKPYEQK